MILMHSSKTMRPPPSPTKPTGRPALLDRAEELVGYLRTLSPRQLAKVMTVSADLAEKTRDQYARWSTAPRDQAPAAESFVGDIYSGLQVDSWTAADRRYADTHLRILSGLYGILRPFDGISPYRLEMGYKLPAGPYANLYRWWGAAIAEQLPAKGRIVNLAAAEYSRTVPCGTESTTPASRSTRRWRDAAGWLMPNSAPTALASCPALRSPSDSSSTSRRRTGSPNASITCTGP